MDWWLLFNLIGVVCATCNLKDSLRDSLPGWVIIHAHATILLVVLIVTKWAKAQ